MKDLQARKASPTAMTDNPYQVDFSAYPHAYGQPRASAVIRSCPEDFRVDEVLGFAPDGDGNHWLLLVEKTGSNSDWVAKQLANHANARFRDVGFNGMKDRHAVTTQWFSIPVVDEALDWNGFSNDEFRIIEIHRHRRKLRRGSHVANRFSLRLRDVTDVAEVLARVSQVREQGAPDYFGGQRFGRRGDNVIRALEDAGAGGRIGKQRHGGIYLSAMRSFLFNAVLAERVSAGSWNQIIEGEAVQLDGSRSFFIADDTNNKPDELAARLAEGDIHPSGPLWGRGELPSAGAAAELEKNIAAEYPELTGKLEAETLKQERRPLRILPGNLDVEQAGETEILCSFSLPAGAYATSVLRELVNATEPRRG